MSFISVFPYVSFYVWYINLLNLRLGSVARKALPDRIAQSERKSQIFYMKMSISDGEKRGILRGEKENTLEKHLCLLLE